MHSIFSRDSWGYSADFDPSLNFCIWVLQVDGLRVPPFDQRPDGDGSLRALGMTASDWKAWFLRTADKELRDQDVQQQQQRALAEFLRISGEPDMEHLAKRYRAEQLKISTAPPLPPEPKSHHYLATWRGSEAIRDRLLELEAQHGEFSQQGDLIHSDIHRAIRKEEQKASTRLYDELKRYAKYLSGFTVHFVAYDYPLDYLLFPATYFMTIQEGQPHPQEYRERMLAAAGELSSRQDRRGKQPASPKYIRLEDTTDQLPGAYRRLARTAVPPRPVKQELPQFVDAAKQTVVDMLSDRPMFGSIDYTTLKFLREKQRKGWRLYEITFQETDGEPYRMISILHLKEDGTWQFVSGGSRATIPNVLSEMHAPVHDHPLLFLTPGWQSLDNEIHLLSQAYGDIIDNGFHVKRVRLVNEAGQILEDTVEDGFVFFACTLEEQVQLPMRAELYDDKDKLVWQETVTVGGRLPPWLKLK